MVVCERCEVCNTCESCVTSENGMGDGVESTGYQGLSGLTLMLTEGCNLRCDYCFVPKKPSRMSLQVAKDAMEFLLCNRNPKKKQLEITLFGGEPFMEWPLIRELVDWAKVRAAAEGVTLGFGATSNMTLLTDEILDYWYVKNRFGLLASLDGLPEVHDAHRKTITGEGSFTLALEGVRKALKYNPGIMARMTYGPDNVHQIVAGVKYLHGLGFQRVAPLPVFEAGWDKNTLAVARAQHEELADWYMEQCRLGRFVDIHPFESGMMYYFQTRPRLQSCGLGGAFVAVKSNGAIYPCHRGSVYKQAVCLGDIYQGYNQEVVSKYRAFDRSKKDPQGDLKCKDCPADAFCMGMCPALNYELFGDYYKVHGAVCAFAKMNYEVTTRIRETLLRERNQPFLNRFFVKRKQGGGCAPQTNLGPVMERLDKIIHTQTEMMGVMAGMLDVMKEDEDHV